MVLEFGQEEQGLVGVLAVGQGGVEKREGAGVNCLAAVKDPVLGPQIVLPLQKNLLVLVYGRYGLQV